MQVGFSQIHSFPFFRPKTNILYERTVHQLIMGINKLATKKLERNGNYYDTKVKKGEEK